MSRRTINLLLLMLLILGAWQVCHMLAGATAVASPWATFAHLGSLAEFGRFWENLEATLLAFAIAGAITVLMGVSVGVMLGMSRFAAEVVEPIMTLIYSLPKITLYPVILLLFGFGLPAKVALGVLHGVVPVALFTMGAVLQVNPVYLRAARALSLSPAATIRHVYIPAALPGIASGLRVGISLTLFGTLIGEMFASNSGLGAQLMASIETAQVETIMALALVLSVFAIAMNAALLRLDRHLRH